MAGGVPANKQRRGWELRSHILSVAKDVFLEFGYEGASMELVALRAETSKRSVYAYFDRKDILFSEVLDLLGHAYLGHLAAPEDYAARPAEAVALFCRRFLQLMLADTNVRAFRLMIAEADRLRREPTAYYRSIFAGTQERLSDYLVDHYGMGAEQSIALARDLLDRVALPSLFRALLNVEEASTISPDEPGPAEGPELDAIRKLVSAVLPAEPKSRARPSSAGVVGPGCP